MANTESIIITFTGTPEFCQAVVDEIYTILTGDSFDDLAETGNKFDFMSSIDPSDDIN